jgi:DNA-binding transcriptional regulator YiaG
MNISELRKQEKLSQDDFANIFHVSRQTGASQLVVLQ